MEPVGAGDDLFVHLELVFGNGFHPRGMKGSEGVADVIDGFVVDSQEVPFLVLENPGGRIMDGAALREDPGQACQTLVLLLVDFGSPGDERQQFVLGEFPGVHAQFGEGFPQRGRVEGIFGQRPGLVLGRRRLRIQRRDRDAVDGFSRVACIPGDHVSPQALLGEDVPDGFDFAGGAADGSNPARHGIQLNEIQDSMPIRKLTG